MDRSVRGIGEEGRRMSHQGRRTVPLERAIGTDGLPHGLRGGSQTWLR
jgi:hypothetical protein